MAFQETTGRYASFGIVASLPGEVIDYFWYIIDNYLKGVIPLQNTLRFTLKNRNGKLSITFSQEHSQDTLTVDFPTDFDSFFSTIVMVFDRAGKETVALLEEINLL